MENLSLAQICALNFSNDCQLPSTGNMEMPYKNEVPPWFVITFAGINGGGFCLNFLSIWLLATRTLIYKYKANWFLVSLCISDMLVALSCFYYLATVTAQHVSEFSKRVSTLIFGFALETSIMSLVCLTYERLTAIRQPFRYKEILSKTNMTIILTVGWLFCIVLTAIQFIFAFIHRHDRYIFINWVVFICLSVIAISFLIMVYMYLIYEIRRHASHIKATAVCSAHPRSSLLLFDSKLQKANVYISSEDQLDLSFLMPPSEVEKIAARRCATPSSLVSSGTSSCRPSLKSSRESRNTLEVPEDKLEELRLMKHRREQATKKLSQQMMIRKERQSFVLCVLIVATFIGCWTPVVTLFVRCLWYGTCQRDDVLLYISSCLVSLNSFLDPVIYFIIKREFRDFIRKAFCKAKSGAKKGRRARERCASEDALEKGTFPLGQK